MTLTPFPLDLAIILSSSPSFLAIHSRGVSSTAQRCVQILVSSKAFPSPSLSSPGANRAGLTHLRAPWNILCLRDPEEASFPISESLPSTMSPPPREKPSPTANLSPLPSYLLAEKKIIGRHRSQCADSMWEVYHTGRKNHA